MADWWDTDSRHPANARSAEFGHKRFFCVIESEDGEKLTFLGTVNYKVDELGLHIEDVDYWPKNEEMREDIENYVRTLF